VARQVFCIYRESPVWGRNPPRPGFRRSGTFGAVEWHRVNEWIYRAQMLALQVFCWILLLLMVAVFAGWILSAAF
jgi:hypothetical protein